MRKVCLDIVIIFLVITFCILFELGLLVNFCYSISLDSILYHLKYFDTIFDVSWTYSILIYFTLLIFLSSILMIWLLSKLSYIVRTKVVIGGNILVLFWLCYSLDVFSYFQSAWKEKEFYSQHYHQPVIEFSKKDRPNLILLFLESMETSFVYDGTSERNLLPELSKYSQKGTSFEEYVQTEGTWWTMGAIVGTHCGIPLSLPFEENIVYDDENFLPGITCLTDILSEKGYTIFFIKGSSAEFAGLDIFLQEHKVLAENIVDYRKLLKDFSHKNDNAWGFPDEKIYPIFKKKIIELSKKDKPFFAMMETIDTHVPFNDLPPKCQGNKDNFADVFRCADQQAGEFINWFLQQPFAEDTVLILLGDHQFMEGYWDEKIVSEQAPRKIFNLFINARNKPKGTIERKLTILDMFPTILESLGIKVSEHRAGLGVSGFSPKSEATLGEQIEKEVLNGMLSGRSRFYKSFLIK